MSAANYLIGNTGQKLKGKSRGVVKKNLRDFKAL